MQITPCNLHLRGSLISSLGLFEPHQVSSADPSRHGYLISRLLVAFGTNPDNRSQVGVSEESALVEKLGAPGVFLFVVATACANQRLGGMPTVMGQQEPTESLFYYFRLEDQIPHDRLLRLTDEHVDLSFVRERLRGQESKTLKPGRGYRSNPTKRNSCYLP